MTDPLDALWQPRTCKRCQVQPVAGGNGRFLYLCWWCALPGQGDPPPCKVCGEGAHWTRGYCRYCHPNASHRSCRDCLSWGTVRSRKAWGFLGPLCYACYKLRLRHPVGTCEFCLREAALVDGSCRLCRHEARRRAETQHQANPIPRLDRYPSQQLFFAGMLPHLELANPGRPQVLGHPPPPPWEPPRAVQGLLFDQRRIQCRTSCSMRGAKPSSCLSTHSARASRCVACNKAISLSTSAVRSADMFRGAS